VNKYPDNQARNWRTGNWRPSVSATLVQSDRAPSVRKGNVSISADLRHLSLILYAIPAERARAIAPSSLQVEETIRNGREISWLSIVSFLDQGSRRDGQVVSEQTNYRLHVLRNGKPAHLLLGISLGSLSLVARRNLWSTPWHLSAMEFHISYDRAEGRYRDYRLQTQSQWANASWEISDTGRSLLPHQFKALALPSSLSAQTLDHYFTRRDGSLGLYRARYHHVAFTSGRLKSAQSDILERLGLLRSDELARPALVAIQRQISCQIFSPTVLGEALL
jgi:hypothetical protein